MTRRPRSNQPRPEESEAAMARVFGVDVEAAEQAPFGSTAPEPAAEEAERRAALGRVFGTEA
jgi:hypothetical protein